MISVIYYFSGTGNCLAAARMLNEKLADKSEIISMPAVEGSLLIKANRIGFVFPVYCHRVPDIVKQFILRMEFESSPYIYAVATHAGEVGQSLFDVRVLLAKKGQSLSLGIELPMPGNARETKPDVDLERLAMLEQKAAEIAGLIETKKKDRLDGENGLIEKLRNQIVNYVAWNYVFSAKSFKSTDACSNCGICEKLCPVNNIRLIDKRPIWEKGCTGCLACFHWCPNEAIYLDTIFIGFGKRRKYHHPGISTNDMICAKEH
jgi:ferredoxin